MQHWSKYFFNWVNVVDLLQFSVNVTIILLNLFDLCPLRGQRMMAAFAVILIFYKFFEWMKLFDLTTFYISLIESTIKSIASFMIIMTCWYFTIGTVIYILDLGNITEDT